MMMYSVRKRLQRLTRHGFRSINGNNGFGAGGVGTPFDPHGSAQLKGEFISDW
jgi:hypothetical protein